MASPTSPFLKHCHIVIGLIAYFSCTQSLAQTHAVDLNTTIIKAKSMGNDTAKVLLLAEIGDQLQDRLPASTDSVEQFYGDVIALATKLNYDSGLIRGLFGRAKLYVQLYELKRKADKPDSLALQNVKRHFNTLLSFVKSTKNDRRISYYYLKLPTLIPPSKAGNEKYLLSLYDSSVQYAQKAGAIMIESESWLWIGFYRRELLNLKGGTEAILRSISVAEKAGRNAPTAAYAELGNAYVSSGDYRGGLPYLQKAYDLSAKDSLSLDPNLASDFGVSSIMLGLAYDRMKDKILALKYNQIALRVFERITGTHSRELVSALGNCVIKLVELNRPKEALRLLEKIKKDHPSLPFHKYEVYLVSTMRTYSKLGNYRIAQLNCDSALAVIEAKPFNGRRFGYSHAVQFFIESKQYDKAKVYALHFRTIASSLKQNDFLARSYYLLHKIDSAQGDFKSALLYFTQYKALSDSSLNETSIREIERLNVEFETNTKEQQLALAKQDTELTRQQLHETRLRSNIMIIGFLVAIAVSAVIFYLYRAGKRTGAKLQQQRDEINEKNLALENLVREKEWLLTEVHHRVKNNLHMIASLLSMQAYTTKDDGARAAIKASENRVQAMSIVHQNLYSDNRVMTVNFQAYLSELLGNLKRGFDTEGIYFNVSADEMIVDGGVAISLGLIVNEAVTNSIKYAFPSQHRGKIDISLHKQVDNRWRLIIQDNGVGISAEQLRVRKSIGLTLIEGIAKELTGDAQIFSTNGFMIQIDFVCEQELEQTTVDSL